MKKAFDDLLHTKGVLGVVLLSLNSKVLYKEYSGGRIEDRLPDEAWRQFAETLDQVKEADIIYHLRRIYLRRTADQILLVLMETDAPMAMIRLKTDTILPQLPRMQKATGLGRFFKRWK
jgi:hypothetical protein